MIKIARLAIVAIAALSLAGCGILFPTARDRAAKNTTGFKSGYSDGCVSATNQDTNYRHDQVRDEASYKSDTNYRAGWSAGFSSCRTNLTRDPARGPIPDNEPGAHRN